MPRLRPTCALALATRTSAVITLPRAFLKTIMTSFGDTAFAMGGVPLLPSIPFGRASKAFFCAPGTDSGGSDGNRGTNVKQPMATLSKAQTLATADHNDTVFMIASSNTAANTTDYPSSALAWAKDGVHLVGVTAGTPISP